MKLGYVFANRSSKLERRHHVALTCKTKPTEQRAVAHWDLGTNVIHGTPKKTEDG
jgi:hypothetical protein